MTKTVAKYGEWKSEISIEAATAGSLALTSPRTDVSEEELPFDTALVNGIHSPPLQSPGDS